MSNLENLKLKVTNYRSVLANTKAYREAWDDSIGAQIMAELKKIMEEIGLSATVEEKEEICNLAVITLSLGNVKSGMSQEVADGVKRDLIKHNGSLMYQQLFNGKVMAIIHYPFIENYGQQQQPNTLSIHRPEELITPLFLQHIEVLLTEVTKWEDYGNDKPQQNTIGFRPNVQQPDLTVDSE